MLDMARKEIISCILIVVLGFFLRFLWISVQGMSHVGDILYERLAVNLLAGHGFTTMDQLPFSPTAVRPPLYSLWIALVYALFGQNLVTIFYSQAFIGAITSVVVYWIGREVHSPKAGLLSAFIYAIHPYPQLFVTTLFPEVFYSLLLALTVLFLWRAWKRETDIQQWILAGVFSGLAALTRSEFFPFALFIVCLILVFRKSRRLIRGGMVFLLAMMLTVLPWTIRNYIHFKKILPISNSFYGVMFMVTTLDESEYDQKQHPSAFYAQPPSYANSYPMAVKLFEVFSDPKNYNRVNEIAIYDEQAFPIGVEKVKKDPLGYLIRRLKEVPYLWIESGNYVLNFVDPRITKTPWKQLLKKPDWWIFSWKFFGLVVTSLLPLGLALFALWRYRHWGNNLIPLISVPLFVTLIHLPFWFEVRYTVPTYPIVFVLTAMGMIKRVVSCQSSVARKGKRGRGRNNEY